MSKKIVIVNPTGGSPTHGPNLRSFYLAKNLLDQGYDVKIIANSYFHKFKKLPNVKNILTDEKIELVKYTWIKSIKYKGRGFNQIINQLVFAFRILINYKRIFFPDTDVIIYSSPTPFAVISTAIISKKLKTKLIFEIRDLWPLVIKEIGNYSTFNPLIILLEQISKFAYKNSDHIVSVKQGDLNYLEKKYSIPPQKMSYIPNGYDIKNFYPAPLSEDIIEKIPKDMFIVGYVGSISAAYSIDQLIKAAKLIKNKDIHFIIVGDGPLLKNLEKYKSENKIKNVSILGRIESSKIPEIVKLFNLCFVGYKKANWLNHGVSSNKIYDYMSQKKPILAALESNYNPIIMANCGFSVTPEQPNEIASSIESIYNLSKSERNQYGQNGFDYLLKHHSFEIISKMYKNTIENL